MFKFLKINKRKQDEDFIPEPGLVSKPVGGIVGNLANTLPNNKNVSTTRKDSDLLEEVVNMLGDACTETNSDMKKTEEENKKYQDNAHHNRIWYDF